MKNQNPEGQGPILIHSIGSTEGLQAEVMQYGATLCGLHVPVGNKRINVVLQYPEPEAYLDDSVYLGSTVGRYAGRIAGASFDLDGNHHELDRNDAVYGHCLHGGAGSLSRRNWTLLEKTQDRLVMFVESPAGDQGFPGNLRVEAEFRIENDQALCLEWRALSDANTWINLTNHAYFNLSGEKSITGHELMVAADRFLPMSRQFVPTGEVLPVRGTPLDLRREQAISDVLQRGGEQLEIGGGVDHYLVFDSDRDPSGVAATLRDPATGLKMSCATSQPGVQCYTGNSLVAPFQPRQAICLEFQSAPNAPNLPQLPPELHQGRLQAGQLYRHQAVLTFED